MAFKIILFAALVAVVNAGFIGGPAVAVAPAIARYSAPAFYGSSLGYHAPLAYHSPLAYHAPIAVSSVSTAPAAKSGAPKSAANAATQDDSEVDPNPSYSFSYDVQDADTGDTKTQSESLENGVVKGSYSVVDPDGIKRTVEYTADAINGFNAVVNTEPSNVVIKTPVVKTVAHAPVVAARTVLAAAPTLYHAAPVTKVLSAPLTKVVSSPHAYSTSHFSYQPSAITYAAAPVHHKIIY